MTALHFWVLFSLVLTIFLWRWVIPNQKTSSVVVGNLTLPLLFLLAFILRLLLAGGYSGFGADIACFSAWADRMAQVGPSLFYAEDFFSDYPPLYLYCLAVTGHLVKAFSVVPYSPIHLILLKLPAILSDLGIGYLLYRVGRKHLGMLSAVSLCSIYLFQPAVILNSTLWGQIDSVFTLILLLVCVLLEQKNLFPAFVMYGAGILCKPQMVIFAPLILVAVFLYVFEPSFSVNRLLKAAGYGTLSILITLLAASPFGLDKVIRQYTDTLGSYPYATVNAYNFWAALGMNWYHQDTEFLGLTCRSWGTFVIFLAAAFSLLIGWHFRRFSGKYGLMGAFLILTMFTFSVRMHERYLYPVMGLLLIAFPGLAARQLSQNSPGKKAKGPALSRAMGYLYPGIFTALSCLHLYNTGHVLYFYDPANYNANAPILILTGAGTVLCALCFYGLVIRLSMKGEEMPTSYGAAYSGGTASGTVACLQISEKQTHMTRTDVILLLAIMALYSFFALRDLGETASPETVREIRQGQTLQLSFSPRQGAAAVSYYIAPEHGRSFLFQFGETGEEQTYLMDNVFTWSTIQFPCETSQITMTAALGTANVIELVFLDGAGNVITPLNASDYPELFDEASLYPEAISFRNSMYFDEIYHARTAYEFLHGLYSYENTHPPLGKVLISLGVSLFGMNPFGWRIIGTLLGIAMLPILYLFAKKLMGSTPVSALTCWIFAFDFMHFAQTRIATIDVYIVFFIICMYYFLYCYLTRDYWGSLKDLLIPLGLCGLSMGLGVACKWTGVYAGIGMGLLFLGHLSLQAETFLHAKKKPSGKTGSHSNQDLISLFRGRTVRIIAFCVVFFIFLPGLIYLLSYLPFRDGSGEGLLTRMLRNQETMFSYHSTLNATHYFASPFFEWPLVIRPIWYYSGILSDTLREGISSFGNPLVWWLGVPAFFYMVYLYLRKKDRRALFLIVGYLAQYIPWFFVTRITFIYHYFPSVVFVVLMIGYSIRNLQQFLSKRKALALILVYGALVFGLFLLFYPVLAGQPIELAFVQKYLRWLKTWILVSG